MKTLETQVAGITFENPFLLASAPPTADIGSIRKAFGLGWAGAVLKTISPTGESLRDASPRFAVLRDDKRKIIGFENIELLSRKPRSYWKQGIAELKREFPRKAVIASIMAPTECDAWQELADYLQAEPIDAFELNFSCPHGMPEKGLGMAIGTDPELAATITGWVKETARVPVFVKLSPNVTDIAAVASAVKRAGADGLSAINTVQCLVGVDLDTLSPLPSVGGRSAFGGYSGRAVKPIGLRCVAQIRAATGLPVLAMGGISSWKDAAEYLAMGGSAVQVCTEVMLNGYGVIRAMLDGLTDYLTATGRCLADLRDAALGKMTAHGDVAGGPRKTARIDPEHCASCGKCLELCAESGYSAIERTGKDAVVNPELCDGCGLCACACPTGAAALS